MCPDFYRFKSQTSKSMVAINCTQTETVTRIQKLDFSQVRAYKYGLKESHKKYKYTYS